eukprot:TRINITY_DN5772_c0_g1_i1.p1 TRINITY_DN5772_c0_g1~~TRINITY_DN5772_c0_g1_i1.p1  ORF type:complete len:348 (-),score=27.41 TRINITY_DN5772_c0_g1_i1:329-1372(-)
MDPQLRFVLLTLIVSYFAKGDILHFNTEFASNCTNIEEGSCCDLLDSKFWIENIAPVDGDGIIINAAEENLCFSLAHPLNLSSVQTNTTKTTIFVENTLSITNLHGQDVWMIVARGSISVSADLELSIQGNITIEDIHVKSFELQYDSILTSRNLVVEKDFTSDLSTTMHCNYLSSGNDRFSQDGLLECDTIVLGNAIVWISGYIKAGTINSTTYFHIEESGEVNVNTLELRALSVHGTLTSANDIRVHFGPYVRGIITVPKLYLHSTATLYGSGIVNGSVESHGRIGASFTIQEPPVSSTQLTITGDLWAANNELHVAIRSTATYFFSIKTCRVRQCCHYQYDTRC